jgi:hypothetical protein
MKNPFLFFRKLVFWELGRNTVTYEIVCAVYIGLLVLLPVNSNGWFNLSESVMLSDGTTVELQREGTTLYFKWSGNDQPDHGAMQSYARARFGAESVVIEDAAYGEKAMKIIPGGWKWRNLLPLQ